MNLHIRPEQPTDYPGISEVTLLAFGNQYGTPLIIPLRRQFASFDPDLSLVAVLDNKVVGHILFSPYEIRLLETTVKAVNLSPLAVHPDHQRKGIGGQLIEAGHRIAAEKGYPLTFVLGHPEYYPRFGYQTYAYGASEVTVTADEGLSQPLETRSPIAADVETLQALWWKSEAAVDFALVPEPTLLEWLSPNPQIACTLYLRNHEVIGYTRIHQAKPDAVRAFLAADADSARAIIGHICAQYDLDKITLPLHPASAAADAFTQKPQTTAWSASMAFSFAPNPFDDYYAQARSGTRPSGRSLWPAPFDLS